MAVFNQSELPSNSFNWSAFWRKTSIYTSVIVGIFTIVGIAFSYALSVEHQFGEMKDRLGKVEGKVEIIQGKPTPEIIIVTPTLLPQIHPSQSSTASPLLLPT